MTFTGFVRDGFHSATRDVVNGVYPADIIGFEPFPGTLNLAVNRGTVESLGEPDHIIDGPECPLWLWNAHIDDIAVAVMYPDRDPKPLVEVLAPVKLRNHLGLRTGDKVTVTL